MFLVIFNPVIFKFFFKFLFALSFSLFSFIIFSLDKFISQNCFNKSSYDLFMIFVSKFIMYFFDIY